MEALLVLLAIILFFLPIVFSIIALLRSKRPSSNLDDSHIWILAERLNELERRIEQATGQVLQESKSAEPSAETTPPPEVAPEREIEKRAARAAAYEVTATAKETKRTEASTEPMHWTPTDSEPEPKLAAKDPTEPAQEPSPEQPAAAPTPWNLEELLGERVAAKLGVAFVAIGMVFLLGLALKELGPFGKILIGYGASGVLLGGGLYAERRDRYRLLGRALLAGGWGILYFVTFAMHFVPASQIIESTLLAVLLLLAAATGAVGFSLRYRNEWTTTFAFLLIYLTLGIAAWQTDATFNLTATTIIAAALSFLVWRLRWDRLLTLGLSATWITMSLWLVPELERLSSTGQEIMVMPILTSLGITWAVFSAAILVRQQNTKIHEGWQITGYMANMFGGFGLIMHHVHTVRPDAAWLVALGFGVLYMLGAWGFQQRTRRPLYLISGTMGLAALALVSPLKLGWGSYWIPISRMLGIQVLLAAGIYLRERYFRVLAYLAFIFTFMEILFFKLESTLLPIGDFFSIPSRIALLCLAGGLSILNVYTLRGPWRTALTKHEFPGMPILFSSFATLFMVTVLWLELPLIWVAPAIAGHCAIWSYISHRWSLLDFAIQGLLLAFVSSIALLDTNFVPIHTDSGIPLRPIAILLVLIFVAIAYARARFPRSDANDTPMQGRTFIAVTHSALAAFTLAVLFFVELPDFWLSPAFMATTGLMFLTAFRARLPEFLYEGVLFTLLGLYAIFEASQFLSARALDLPARPVSILLSIVFVVVAQLLLQRFHATKPEEVSRQLYVGNWHLFELLTGAYLTLATVLFFWLVKTEALLYDKNLLVALLWGIVGVIYLEVARNRGWRTWLLHGHATLAAATVHLFLVNFLQEGSIGSVSLRVVTVVPFFAFLAYVFHTWDDTLKPFASKERLGKIRYAYLYVMVGILATLIAYELFRAWVIVGWAILAVALLIRAQLTDNWHWRFASLLMAGATLTRGLAVNLYFRDEVADVRINLMAVPLACAALLAGYVIHRHKELEARSAEQPEQSLGQVLREHRTGWLGCSVILLTSFIWVEAAGTILTVWLSVEGLGIITLGFVAKERIARLGALLMLTGCVLKLFIYDLRGLEGIPRVLSFIVLGVVLIAVSYVYTRFKERIQEYL